MADIMDEDPSSGLQSSEEEEEPEGPVDSLISGRAKRSTAGQHMSALIDAAADDDLSLLFQEVDDDNEFAMEVEAAEEEDLGLDSSEDDDEDQGPNAQNDYEGEKELQKEERKKRKTQNDLRFQTLRKRVKIDPTVSSVPAAAPRPKKKSERISWLPTPEDGPTRSSSRRQTMVNKELTHARLKDSQEKRIRIIATMKEAEKRKAHLKPKEMTQEDRLAEAARVERMNSKSLNRWEQTERRKADERRARIEALQNRRLEGPVISYWSGLATWTNGRLTRVGKVDIKVKPEKDESKKKKKAEEKAAETQPPSSTPGPSQSQQPLQSQQPPQLQQPSLSTSAIPVGTTAPSVTGNSASDQNPVAPAQDAPKPESPAPPPIPGPAETNKPDDQPPEQNITPAPPSKNEKGTDGATPSFHSRSADKYPIPVVEIPAYSRPHTQTPSKSPDQAKVVPSVASASNPPADTAKVEASTPSATEQANQATAASPDTPAVSGEANQVITGPKRPDGPFAHHVTPQSGSATTPLGPQNPAVPSGAAAPVHATPGENTAIQGHQPGSTIQAPAQTQSHGPAAPSQPEQPPPPPVIEHTGRNLTILENFDDKTAHSKKYSMYFNAKKPARLTSMSSLIV